MLVVNVVQFIVFGLNFIFLCFHTRPYLSIYAMEIRTYMKVRLEPQHMHATLDVIYFFLCFLREAFVSGILVRAHLMEAYQANILRKARSHTPQSN